MATSAGEIDRLAGMRPSAIRDIHDLAQRLKRDRPDRRLLPLHFGEPDRGTPRFIVDAGCAALRGGAVFYENNAGRPDLQSALSEHFRRHYGVGVAPEQFVVTCGGMQAIALAVLGALAPGDDAINITPNWPNFSGAARLAGANVREVPLGYCEAQRRFRLDLQRVREAIDAAARPRMVIVNSPSNPTGWMLTCEEQAALIDLCRERNLFLLADEMYDRIAFTALPCPTALRHADWDRWDRLIAVNGFSKTYCMTGWRVGYLVTAPGRAAKLAQMQEFLTSHAPSMAQVAAITALRDGEAFVAESLGRYRHLRDRVLDGLSSLPGARVAIPEGSFYAFFSLPQARDSVAFCRDLLLETGVVLAPGSAFGAGGEGWLRVCFANEAALLEEALERLGGFVARRVRG